MSRPPIQLKVIVTEGEGHTHTHIHRKGGAAREKAPFSGSMQKALGNTN